MTTGRTPGSRGRVYGPDAELAQELATCYAEGCHRPAWWRHRSEWGPHWCGEHVDRVPDAVSYLYRHRITGRWLDD